MKTVGKILGGLWVISFGIFFLLNFISENKLPEYAIEYRNLFRASLEAFLKSPWFLVVFIAMWFFVVIHLAKKSGWKGLAELYSGDYVSPIMSNFSRGSGYIGKISYNGILKVCADSVGLYIKVIFPFSFGHKPLLIPWRDIKNVVDEKALVSDKTPKILRKVAELFTRAKYKRIELKTYPDQKLVIPWDKRFNDLSRPPYRDSA